MDYHDKSEKRARQILRSYVDSISEEFNEYICTIMLVGSLTNGSYIEGPGRDIDQITVIHDDTSEGIRRSLLKRIDEIQNSFNNDIPIAKSIYKYREMQRPFKTDIKMDIEDKFLLELPTELLRIHESGIVLYGKDIISQLPVPTRDEVIFFDKLALEWGREMGKKMPPRKLQEEELPIRLVVQVILTNAFRHYFYFTGKSCSNKHEIANRIKTEIKHYRFQELLDLAAELKMNPDRNFLDEEVSYLRTAFNEFRDWIKNHPVDAVPLDP